MRTTTLDRPANRTDRTRPPARAAGGRARHRGPRYLLPPVVEPAGSAPSAVGESLPALRELRSAAAERAWERALLATATPPPPLPDPAAVCGPVVLAAVEALTGSRPVAQLVRWVSPSVHDALASRVRANGRPTGPLRRATVLRSHLCRVSDTVAEAAVVVHDGSRVRAGALRLEVHRGHWRATVLQIA